MLPTSIGWRDPRTKEGDLLWPDRFNRDEVERLKKALGSYAAAAQLQQRPAPIGGGMLKTSWLRRWRPFAKDGIFELVDPDGVRRIVHPNDTIKFLTVDLATSEKTTADYTVILAWQLFGQSLVLTGMDRDRIEGSDLVRRIKSMSYRHGASFVAIERQGFQLAIIQQARKKGLPVRELKADRDKVSRALAAAPFMEAGQLYVPEDAPWLSDFEQELTDFPNGSHDDQVDAMVYGVLVAFRYGWIEPGVGEARRAAQADIPCSDERDRAPDPMDGFRPAGTPW